MITLSDTAACDFDPDALTQLGDRPRTSTASSAGPLAAAIFHPMDQQVFRAIDDNPNLVTLELICDGGTWRREYSIFRYLRHNGDELTHVVVRETDLPPVHVSAENQSPVIHGPAEVFFLNGEVLPKLGGIMAKLKPGLTLAGQPSRGLHLSEDVWDTVIAAAALHRALDHDDDDDDEDSNHGDDSLSLARRDGCDRCAGGAIHDKHGSSDSFDGPNPADEHTHRVKEEDGK